MSLRITLSSEQTKEITYIINNNIDRILLNSKLVGIRRVDDWERHVSNESLNIIRNKKVNVSTNDNLINFSQLKISDKLVHIVQKSFPENTIQVSGYFHYPNTGYMSWHTNADVPCQRLYITWTKEAGKSFFRYYENGQIITDYDDAGLTFRLFNITDKPPYLWHCVGSETDRLSFGFRIL